MKPSRPVFVFSIGLTSVFLTLFTGAPASEAPLAALFASLIAVIAGALLGLTIAIVTLLSSS